MSGTSQTQEQVKVQHIPKTTAPKVVLTTESTSSPTALQPLHVREALQRFSRSNLTAPVSPLWVRKLITNQPATQCPIIYVSVLNTYRYVLVTSLFFKHQIL